MALTDKILEAINADLPAATAGELKKYIEQSEADKKALADVKSVLIQRDADLKAVKEQVAKLAGYADKEASLNNREAEILKREELQAHKDEITKLKDYHADEKVSIVLEVTKSVFQNNRFKYNMTSGYSDSNNSYSPNGSTNENRSGSANKTIETEE